MADLKITSPVRVIPYHQQMQVFPRKGRIARIARWFYLRYPRPLRWLFDLGYGVYPAMIHPMESLLPSPLGVTATIGKAVKRGDVVYLSYGNTEPPAEDE